MGTSAFVCLLFASLVYSSSVRLPQCDPANRDCSCADKSFKSCDPPAGNIEPSDADSRELCELLCTFEGSCTWYMFFPNKDKGNCVLYKEGEETFEQYIASCERTMQPVRRADGTCTVGQTDPTSGECNSLICPQGCQACDEADECNVNYHEAECSMISPAVSTFSTPSLDFCIAVCATTGLSNPNTYASWDSHLHECNCFETGARRCQMEVVKAGFSNDQIQNCINQGFREAFLLN